jgi:GNAT superfamily N-acetyltransferase
MACAAAASAGVAGRFRVWEQSGLLAVLATDPALSFLSTVTGVTPANLSAAVDFIDTPVWSGVRPVVVGSGAPGGVADAQLLAAGFVRTHDRGLAVRAFAGSPAVSAAGAGLEVVDIGVDKADFLQVLLAGYEVDGTVAAFIAAEHRIPVTQGFLVFDHDVPIAAAAMTIHGSVAVLGGAATVRTHRGKGAQPRLLHHRLRLAADAGCTAAVATAHPDSVSAANLRAAGFSFHRRPTWIRR